MRPGGVRSFALELARDPGGAYRGGERLCGRVLLEAASPLRVTALEVAARGGAVTHWLEGRSVGVNAVSSDYAAAETYLRRRQLLLLGEPLIPPHPEPGSPGTLYPGLGAPLQSQPFDLEAVWSGDPPQDVETSSSGCGPSYRVGHPPTYPPPKPSFPGTPPRVWAPPPPPPEPGRRRPRGYAVGRPPHMESGRIPWWNWEFLLSGP